MVQWVTYSQCRISKDHEYTLCYPLIHAIGCNILWKFNNKNAAGKVFLLQERIIRIMSCPQRNVSNKYLYKRFCILKLRSEYTFDLMTLKVYNYEISLTNSKFHEVNTKHRQYSKRLYTMQEFNCIASSQ